MTKSKDISYREAVDEIEAILRHIEEGKLDVDQLGKKVKRVTYLLDACKKKLRMTEEEVGRIIEEMDQD